MIRNAPGGELDAVNQLLKSEKFSDHTNAQLTALKSAVLEGHLEVV